eukprot:gene10517-3039_t
MNENNFLNPIYIFAVSSFLVLYQSTKNHFLPEVWFSGLQIILPQFKNEDISIEERKKKTKKKQDTFVQIVTLSEGVLRKLYFFSEFVLITWFTILMFLNFIFYFLIDKFYQTQTNHLLILLLLSGIGIYSLILLQRVFYSTISLSSNSIDGHVFLSILCGIISFFISFHLLSTNNDIIDFNGDNVYSKFKVQIDIWLEYNLYNIRFPNESLIFKLLLSFFCGWITLIFYQPCLSFIKYLIRMNTVVMKKVYFSKTNMFVWNFLNFLNLILPLSITLLNFNFFQHLLMNNINYLNIKNIKLFLLFLTIILRISFLRVFVQSYLLHAAKLVNENDSNQTISRILYNHLKLVMVPIIQLFCLPILLLVFSLFAILSDFYSQTFLFLSFWSCLMISIYSIIFYYVEKLNDNKN